MNQGTKQRVVGAVVLLVLALIFVPLVLDGDGNYQPTISSRIPAPPIVDFMPEPSPERPVIDADLLLQQSQGRNESLVSSATSLPDDNVNEPPEQIVVEVDPVETAPSLDELALPEGWSVRLGVFSNTANAQNLTRRLLEAGYRGYSQKIQGAQGTVTGVFVGPHVERAEANLLKERLQDEFELAGLIVRFEVESIP